MRVIGVEEYAVSQHRRSAVCALCGITRDGPGRRSRPRIAPDLSAGLRIERAHLIRSGHVHHAVDHEGSHLQAVVWKRIGPLKLETAYVFGVDLVERAVTIRSECPVVGWPLARFAACRTCS